MNTFMESLKRLASYVILGVSIIGITGMVLHSMAADSSMLAIDPTVEVESIYPVELPVITPNLETATDILAKAAKAIEEKPAELVEEILPPATELEPVFEYKVKSGDSLWGMANKFYKDGNLYEELAWYNSMNIDNVMLHPGDIILIPPMLDGVNSIYAGQGDFIESQNAELNSVDPLVIETKDESKPLPGSVTSNGDILEVFKQTVTYVEDTSNMEYLGDYFITGYTPTCAHCCGKSNAITASGALATIDRTVSMKGLPFGTEIYIEGYGFYVVEDRGVGKGIVDIARLTHEDCGTVTKHNIPVYIVK